MSDPEIIPPEEKPKRPGEFSDEIFDEICDRMADGQGLRKICADPSMPSRQTLLRWIEKDTGRQNRYQAARESLMDWYAEEILEIAFDDKGDIISEAGKVLGNHAAVQRARLKVDALKWTMSKLYPKRYGERAPEMVVLQAHEAEAKAAPLKIEFKWEREIISPIHDDAGNVINCNDNSALRARIRELEARLGIQEDGEILPPKQITYDPGPLPSRTEGQILYSIAQAIKNNVPKADQRPPEEVISEVMEEFERLLQAKYSPANAA